MGQVHQDYDNSKVKLLLQGLPWSTEKGEAAPYICDYMGKYVKSCAEVKDTCSDKEGRDGQTKQRAEPVTQKRSTGAFESRLATGNQSSKARRLA